LRAIDSQRADHALRTGNVTKAIEAGRHLLASDGDEAFAQASRDLGVALALAGRTAEALVRTEQGLKARQTLENQDQVAAAAVFFVAQALALAEAGRLAEAIAIAEVGYEQSV